MLENAVVEWTPVHDNIVLDADFWATTTTTAPADYWASKQASTDADDLDEDG